MIALRQDQPQAALSAFQSALAITEKYKMAQEQLRTLQNIALTQERLGNEEEALQRYQENVTRARASKEAELEAQFLVQLGQLQLRRQQAQAALENLEQASNLTERSGILEMQWQAHTAAGQALAALGKRAAARARFTQAITTIEQIRRHVSGTALTYQNFFQSQPLQNRLTPYHALLALQVKERDFAGALESAQRAQGRVLLELMQSGGPRRFASVLTPAELQQAQKLDQNIFTLNRALTAAQVQNPREEAQLTELRTQLQTARNAQETLQNAHYAAHPELQWKRGNLPTLDPAALSALLPDTQTAILNYITTTNQTFLFVLTKLENAAPKTPCTVQVYELPLQGKQLSDRVEQFRRRIANRDFAYQPLARELYDQLLAPAVAQLQGMRSLIIIPDGALWNLPFQALQPAHQRFLLEDFALTYVPSLPVLREISQRRAQRATTTTSLHGLLAFGDPLAKQAAKRTRGATRELMNEALAPLPDATRQVNGLRRIYGAQQSQVYLGTAAREERFKTEAAQYRILHLATHGEFNDQNPLYSYLVLANPAKTSGEDGLLEAWELLNLNLRAELVVLSACETARGRIGTGEGVIGLSWAFFAAGCSSTVVSQWKVESESTADLMLAFHRRWQTSMPTAEALRQASLQLLRQRPFQHPFYWASFILIGDGR